MAARPLRILLGHISGAHGIRGEVLIKSYAAAPDDIGAYGPLSDDAGMRTYELTVRRVTPKGVIARVAGVGDRTGAEALKGTRLYIERSRLPAPDDGEFYHADLIGLDAVTPAGDPLGEIVSVANYGAGDLLEIKLAGEPRTEFVPFTDACVPDVDLTRRRVVVVPPPASDEQDEP